MLTHLPLYLHFCWVKSVNNYLGNCDEGCKTILSLNSNMKTLKSKEVKHFRRISPTSSHLSIRPQT